MSAPSTAGRLAAICAIASVAVAATSVAQAQLPPPAPMKAGPGQRTAPTTAVPAATTVGATSAYTPTAYPVRRHVSQAWHDKPVLRSAYRRAVSTPGGASFVNGNQVYAYEPNRIYRIDASPRFLTVIALRPGERLVSKAAGDTVRWVIGETAGASNGGGLPQTLVLIKPLQGGLRTNVVLTTDQRIYLVEAVSHEEPIFTSMVSWNYPADEMRELQLARSVQTVQTLARQANVVDTNLNVSRLNFNYDVRPTGPGGGVFHSTSAPAWMPVRVFDDGSKTYIQFPSNLASSEAPPLFLVGPHNSAELVNYRFSNGYYVVDRLFGVAELRLGEKPQTIVRITSTGPRSTMQ
jgi:type IV secretion system protein VirB9